MTHADGPAAQGHPAAQGPPATQGHPAAQGPPAAREHPDARGGPDDGAGRAPAPAAPPTVPTPDGDEIAAFWQLARGRAGLGRLAVLIGTGGRASVPPPAWAFTEDPDEADRQLARVLDGSRTATAVPRSELADAGLALPEPGDLSIVVDGRGHPRALLRTTAVRTAPLAEVEAERARAEGDGAPAPWPPGTEMVLERFEVRFPPRSGGSERPRGRSRRRRRGSNRGAAI